ncbi:hypothetical protein L208DRAFT_1410690, partial [Tricholoma matsutake]
MSRSISLKYPEVHRRHQHRRSYNQVRSIFGGTFYLLPSAAFDDETKQYLYRPPAYCQNSVYKPAPSRRRCFVTVVQYVVLRYNWKRRDESDIICNRKIFLSLSQS